MKNFIFISPNFPSIYDNFCYELKNDGLNVLGIGDCPYDDLSDKLKYSLTEYYKVNSLENYDEVFKAVAFLSFKYGKPDYLESNNEYWLLKDALLRDEFNIDGFKSKDMDIVKYKSKMKQGYKKANIKTARYTLDDNYDGALKFIQEVGYPVIAKPDNGVGANGTYKIKNEEDLKEFIKNKSEEQYILEEYIDGTIISYDAIVNSKGEAIFETGNVTPIPLIDVVNSKLDCPFFIRKEVPIELIKMGRACIKAFNIKSRFIHLEFFLLNKDQNIGKKGEIVALEVNMRPSGGVSTEMMNYANNVNVYKIYADMIANDLSDIKARNKKYAAFYGRRDDLKHKHSNQEVLDKYGNYIVEHGRVEKGLSGAMGDEMFIGTFENIEELKDFYKFISL